MKKTEFTDPDLTVVACRHVVEQGRVIALVGRYDDGSWTLTCGKADHSEAEGENDDYVLVHALHFSEQDASINEVSDLKCGWEAERDAKGLPWRRFKSVIER